MAAPINRNIWFNISLFAALILVCVFTAVASRQGALQAAPRAMVMLWVLHDLTYIFSSEPLAFAIDKKQRHAPMKDRTEELLARAATELGEQMSNPAPILLLATDVNSQYVAQKLPFELLPKAAAHINQRRAASILTDWHGAIAVIGEDQQLIYKNAMLIKKTNPDMTASHHDGFVLLQSKIP